MTSLARASGRFCGKSRVTGDVGLGDTPPLPVEIDIVPPILDLRRSAVRARCRPFALVRGVGVGDTPCAAEPPFSSLLFGISCIAMLDLRRMVARRDFGFEEGDLAPPSPPSPLWLCNDAESESLFTLVRREDTIFGDADATSDLALLL